MKWDKKKTAITAVAAAVMGVGVWWMIPGEEPAPAEPPVAAESSVLSVSSTTSSAATESSVPPAPTQARTTTVVSTTTSVNPQDTFVFNPTDNDQNNWPTTVFADNMNRAARYIASIITAKDVGTPEGLEKVRRASSSPSVVEDVQKFSMVLGKQQAKGVELVRSGYSDAVFDVVFSDGDDRLSVLSHDDTGRVNGRFQMRFAVKMAPSDPKRWKLTQIAIVVKDAKE